MKIAYELVLQFVFRSNGHLHISEHMLDLSGTKLIIGLFSRSKTLD